MPVADSATLKSTTQQILITGASPLKTSPGPSLTHALNIFSTGAPQYMSTTILRRILRELQEERTTIDEAIVLIEWLLVAQDNKRRKRLSKSKKLVNPKSSGLLLIKRA